MTGHCLVSGRSSFLLPVLSASVLGHQQVADTILTPKSANQASENMQTCGMGQGQSQDPEWCIAENEASCEETAPTSHIEKCPTNVASVENCSMLNLMPWFHVKITRLEAERLLSPPENGLFLVRESTNYPGDYTLCLSTGDKVEHYHIRYGNGKLTIGDELYFDNLIQLVEHYGENTDGLCTRLTKPKLKPNTVTLQDDLLRGDLVLSREDLELQKIIGKGKFAELMMAEYKGHKVTAKRFKKDPALQAFITEVDVLMKLSHNNVVKLLGVNTEAGGHLLIITEYMMVTLEDYLHSRGRTVLSRVALLKFAQQVCDAMVYLESNNFVHRDLAARNVMLSENLIAKVSDFSLTMKVSSVDDTKKLSVKWASPEALQEKKFSSKSDVWSYGILLWEIYSFGRRPYQKMDLKQVVPLLKSGYRLPTPEECPEAIYDIMKHCWHWNPESRPSFKLLEEWLLGLSNNLKSDFSLV